MNIGQAVEVMKRGGRVARKGWNGRGMHVYLEDRIRYVVGGGVFAGSTRIYDPVVVMFTAQGTHQAGWLCSQADLLAEDWYEVAGED